MYAKTKMNKPMLACLALGMAGALWALDGQPAKAHSPERVEVKPEVCAIAADYARDASPAMAAELRRAVGCAPEPARR